MDTMPAAGYSEEFKAQVVRDSSRRNEPSPRSPRRMTLSPRR